MQPFKSSNREGEFLPMLLSLPKGSIAHFREYLKLLISKGRRPNAVVTLFSLTTTTNKKGVLYSQAKFSIDRVLKPEEYALVKKLSGQVMAYSSNLSYDYDAPTGSEGGNSGDNMVIDPETGEVFSV